MNPRKIFNISGMVVSLAYIALTVHMFTSGNTYSAVQWKLSLLGAVVIMFCEGFFGAMIDDMQKKSNMNNEKMKQVLSDIVADLKSKSDK